MGRARSTQPITCSLTLEAKQQSRCRTNPPGPWNEAGLHPHLGTAQPPVSLSVPRSLQAAVHMPRILCQRHPGLTKVALLTPAGQGKQRSALGFTLQLGCHLRPPWRSTSPGHSTDEARLWSSIGSVGSPIKPARCQSKQRSDQPFPLSASLSPAAAAVGW